MPFKSKAQMRAAFSGALGKKMKKRAKLWVEHTPDIESLPEKVKKSMAEFYYVIMKAEVSPFTRTRKGKLERVKGWFITDPTRKVVTYPATDRGFFDFVKTHIGLDRYGALVLNIAKTTPDIMVAVNDAYLAVINEGSQGAIKKQGLNLRSFLLKDKEGLKKFMIKVYEMVKDDILSIRKDLRKARTVGAKDIKKRKIKLSRKRIEELKEQEREAQMSFPFVKKEEYKPFVDIGDLPGGRRSLRNTKVGSWKNPRRVTNFSRRR